MPIRTRFLPLGALLAVLPFSAHAEAEPPHPVVDIPRAAIPSMELLRSDTVGELLAQRETYLEQLEAASAAPTEELEERLLQALLVYDDERIRIIGLIPRIIERYEVEGTLREDLMSFRSTLIKIVEELRPEVTTLQKYKPYDFRLGISYAAMMTIMQRKREVRDRMLRDQGDSETMLGQHALRLRETYRAVEEARERLEASYRTEAIRDRIERVDAELRRRQS